MTCARCAAFGEAKHFHATYCHHSQDVLDACLHTSRLDPDADDPDDSGFVPVDLLIRTSGEHRLSDFAVAQCAHAQLLFTRVLWPDLGFSHLAAALLRYQAHAGHHAQRTADALTARRMSRERSRLLALRQRETSRCGCCHPDVSPPSAAEVAALSAQAQGRHARVSVFLRERERLLRAWEASAALGDLQFWPPPMAQRQRN